MKSGPDIGALLERLARILQNESHAEGLKPAQWEALRFLARANRFSRTPSGVTAYLGVTKGTVSQTLNALENKKLIAKKTGAADRRQVGLALTAKGKRLLANDPLETVLNAASRLPATSRQALADNLSELLRGMLGAQDGRPFGACHTCRYFRAHDADGAPHLCALLNERLTEEDSALICIEQEPAAA